MKNIKEISNIVDANRQHLSEMGYDEETISAMSLLMIEILMYLIGTGIAPKVIFHKNMAETFRSLANIIELMAVKNDN